MWIIGSNDISLKINLKNYGEPAYLTTLEFIFPERVILRSILPSCQEDISKENLIVICDIGNPIWEEEEVKIFRAKFSEIILLYMLNIYFLFII